MAMKFVLTNKGLELKAKIEAGAVLNFTKAETGDIYSPIPLELQSVPNARQILDIDSIIVNDDTATVKIILSNLENTEEYYIKQLGLYASDPDTGDEILYIIGQDSIGERVPAITDMQVEYEFDVNIKAGNAASIRFEVNGEAFLRKKQFQEFLDEKFYPHTSLRGTADEFGHVKLSDVYESKIANGDAANGLGASQNALYNVYNKLNSDLINKIYPVGSIYMSVNNVSPSNFLGGTWERFAQGRTLIGVNPNDGTYNGAQKTGGSATTTLGVANIPPHSHSFNWSGKPTGSARTLVSIADNGNHVHTAGALVANSTNITGSIGNMMTDNSTGLLANGVFSCTESASHGRYGGGTSSSSLQDIGKLNATHSHSIGGNTEWAGTHSHLAIASTEISMNNITVSGNTGNTGNGAAINNMQPYITCYMWKRTA